MASHLPANKRNSDFHPPPDDNADDFDLTVSRNHCEVYVVTYEPSAYHVYVRDRKSLNGTFVNDRLIGKGPDIAPGYLLQDGDVITILPRWIITFSQFGSSRKQTLTALQQKECEVM
jgi:pSer/pThr/pTyr-binding forkhead associated (FHA) protein